MFIVAVVQHIKIGDLSQQGDMSHSSDEAGYTTMDVDDSQEGPQIGDTPRLSRFEEYSLVRDSTAGFAGENIQVRDIYLE